MRHLAIAAFVCGTTFGCFVVNVVAQETPQEAPQDKQQSQLRIVYKKKTSPEAEKQYLKEHPEANFVLDADTQLKQQTAPKPKAADMHTKESVVIREIPGKTLKENQK